MKIDKTEMKLTECPRDAMQGLRKIIPTELKIEYINLLLKVGFDTIDFGSFVSPRAIPQLSDTAKVLNQLDLDNTNSKLLSIVANVRGADDASEFDEINYLGFPFSISETFQKRNTNASIIDSLKTIDKILSITTNSNKKLVVYISMAFGNPYDDPWSIEIVEEWCDKLHNDFGVNIIALSDTIGVSNKENISTLFTELIPKLPQVKFTAHLHTNYDTWEEKIKAAYSSGCKSFDGAIKGFGGCPMAKDKLTGNMPTEKMIEFFEKNNLNLNLNKNKLEESIKKSSEIFPFYI